MTLAAPEPPDPHAEYSARHAARVAAMARLEKRHDLLANARLAVFLAGAALAAAIWRMPGASWAWLVLPALAFAALVAVHARTLRARDRAERAAAHYRRGLDRIEDRWQGAGATGADLAPEHHPYAADLDIFGRGSLFQLLCTAVTRTGQDTLARWLCAPADLETVRARQAAVRELRDRLDFREAIADEARAVAETVHPRTLERWAAAPRRLEGRWLRPGAAALSAGALAALTGFLLYGWLLPLAAAVTAQLLLLAAHARAIHAVQQAVAEPCRELPVFARVLAHLENENFESPLLRSLQAELVGGGAPASRRIAGLERLLQLFDAQRNMLFGPIAILLLWGVHTARALEDWRAAHGPEIARWLDAAGAFEALLALSAFAYERPAYPFPELETSGPLFDGDGLAHPLLPRDTAAPNDVRLDSAMPAYIVSGSNMSGKSTLLRTVGANAVLALAGAPVRARRLRLSPLAIGATMRVHDSIQEGASRFYAEITRLRQLQDIARGPVPLLFLLDEILHGTNSHDRRIGAAAVLRQYLAAGAIGLATTHDLAITEVAAECGHAVRNVHFADTFEGGAIRFDYRLREGVVRKSNALELMRSLGLLDEGARPEG